jgi:outer membrane protein assembly factor BamD (BamD/ComL family)
VFDLLGSTLPPSDPRYLRLHFYQGEVLFAQGNQLQAVREFRRVADEQPEGPLAADALVRAGDAYADLWRRPELDPTYGQTARTVYEEVVSRYGGTPAAGRASLRLAALSESFARKEFKNALFYFRYKAWDSAILLLRSVIATIPGRRWYRSPSGWQIYQRLNYQEDVKETCAYITQYHPNPQGPARLCSKASDGGSDSVRPPPTTDTVTVTGRR